MWLSVCSSASRTTHPICGRRADRLSPLPIKAVTIRDAFWAPRIEVNRTRTIDHVLQQIESTGGLRNFDIAAGKATGTSSHEDFSSGHLFEAAVAHYQATGKKTLLTVATRLADLFAQQFGPGKQDYISGHEGIELALVKLYHATNEQRYLDLAKAMIDRRGQKPSIFERQFKQLDPNRTVNFLGKPLRIGEWYERFYLKDPRKFDTRYAQDHLPVREQKEAVGHAVRAMFLYCAMADLVHETSDAGLWSASKALHDSVTLHRMYVTGGIGPSEYNEGFTEDYDLPNENAYQETCASAAMVLWNHRLFRLTGDATYTEVMEQSLYNAVAAGVSMRVNGTRVSPQVTRGYAAIRRQWQRGDTVELSLPMDVQRLVANPKVLHAQGKIALRRGPMIYSFEQADNASPLREVVLPAGATFHSQFDPALAGGVVKVTTEGLVHDAANWDRRLYQPAAASASPLKRTPLTAVPYAIWGNRGLGQMIVWIDSSF